MPSLPKPRLRRTARTRAAVGSPTPETQTPQVVTIDAGPEGRPLRWINVERWHPAERAWLEEHFEFHQLDYEDVASRNQRPKLDAYDDYLFLVLHFGVFDKVAGRLLTVELDVFVGPDFVITLPDGPLPPIAAMFERYRLNDELRESVFSKGPGYLLYKIVDTAVDASFPQLRRMGEKLDRLEDDIFEGRSAEIVRDISNAKQEIISYRKTIKPERATLRLLERHTERFLPQDLELYFDDIVDAAERVWDLLENYKEVVEGLESTNESVIYHKQSDILRILTLFSVTMLPLTLIAGVFGMNVIFPGEGGHVAFWVILGVMVVALSAMVGFFRWKKWL